MSVDAAVLPFVPPETAYRHLESIVRVETFVDERDLSYRIGLGDEVFITGLFAPVTGDARNLPIVRMGNIAMVPGEQRIPVEEQQIGGYTVRDMEGYLTESRSIGGISGSPCFVRATVKGKDVRYLGGTRSHYVSSVGPHASDLRALQSEIGELSRKLDEALRTRPLGVEERYSLLGLMHGHWDIPAEEKNDIAGEEGEAVNMGIAIVVPAAKIKEILGRPELVNMRQEAGEVIRAKYAAKMDAQKGGESDT